MTKVWWEKILHNYPQALESCKLYFQHRYQDQWRNQIQNPITSEAPHHLRIRLM